MLAELALDLLCEANQLKRVKKTLRVELEHAGEDLVEVVDRLHFLVPLLCFAGQEACSGPQAGKVSLPGTA